MVYAAVSIAKARYCLRDRLCIQTGRQVLRRFSRWQQHKLNLLAGSRSRLGCLSLSFVFYLFFATGEEFKEVWGETAGINIFETNSLAILV